MLAVKHLVQTEKEILQREVESLRRKQTRLETEYTAHRKQSHEEKEELENQLKKMKRIMAGYREFLLLPEIRPLHIEFVERRRIEQLQRQQEEERQRQEQEIGTGASAGALRPWHEDEVRRREEIFAQAEDIGPLGFTCVKCGRPSRSTGKTKRPSGAWSRRNTGRPS